MSFTDHARSPRLPLGQTALHDLAHALTEERPMTIEYDDLRQLILNGPRYNVDPRAVELARERLTAAADRGSAAAAGHLAVLAVEEEGDER
jgi:hypothetical protein